MAAVEAVAMDTEEAVVMAMMITTATMAALVAGMTTTAAMKNMISIPRCHTAWQQEGAVVASCIRYWCDGLLISSVI